MSRIALLAAAPAAMLAAAPLSAQETGEAAFVRAVEAVQARMAPIDAQPDRIPARALVFVDADGSSIVDVRGTADIESGRAVDEDTPFYIASMTKAFVGLLAVRLDREGILPLETPLSEIYPQMRVEGVDLSQVTLRDALSHRLGFNSPALSFRNSYTDAVPMRDIAKVVNASQEATDPGFSYANLGYLLYAGALEERTGRGWKAWLDELVLGPLGMRHSSARSSDLPLASKTHEIYTSGWRTYDPKPDTVSHAAGGLFVSGADMARWLAANAGAPGKIPSAAFAATHAKAAVAERAQGPVKCDGYGLGWALCEAGGVRFLEHGGTYTGMRSEMIVLPDQGVAFAAMFNSDSMTGGLGLQLATTFVLTYAGEQQGLPPVDAFAATYAQKADRYRERRSDDEAKLGEQTFAPDNARLAQYAGRFGHPAYGTLDVFVGEDALRATLNEMPLVLHAIGPDHYAARISTGSGNDDLKFLRDEGGAVIAVDWAQDVFRRQ